jgi:tripartite-type tricarboxylate transporter receptor subunit TctC
LLFGSKQKSAALADPLMKGRFAELGGVVFPTSPADFGTFVAEDRERWGKVIRAAGSKAE